MKYIYANLPYWNRKKGTAIILRRSPPNTVGVPPSTKALKGLDRSVEPIPCGQWIDNWQNKTVHGCPLNPSLPLPVLQRCLWTFWRPHPSWEQWSCSPKDTSLSNMWYHHDLPLIPPRHMLVILTMIGPDVISEACWIKWPTSSTRASEPDVKTICCSSENAAGKMAVTWTVPVSVCRYVWSTSDAVKRWNCQKASGVTEFKTCSQNIFLVLLHDSTCYRYII